MLNTPSISVIMPAYNAGKFIGEAITSVLAQGFADFELLVIDDGSVDDTKEIVTGFCDPRIRYFYQQKKGISDALNAGLVVARASLVARFDADDICYPQRLEKQFRLMQERPEIVIAGSAVDYIDAAGHYIFTYNPQARTAAEIRCLVKRSCPFIHSSVIYRKQAVLDLGGYSREGHTFEDHLLWTRLLETGDGFNTGEALIKVRLNPGSLTIDEKWRPRQFRKLKRKILSSKNATKADGEILASILLWQQKENLRLGAYHSLLAKKFLWNNYKPADVRSNLKKSLATNRLNITNYFLYLLSYLPPLAVQKIYRVYKSIEDRW